MADIARLEGIDIGELMARVPNLPANNEDDELGAGDLNFAEFDLESVLNKAAPLLAVKKSVSILPLTVYSYTLRD